MTMKREMIAGVLLASLVQSHTSVAANWFQLQNNEMPGAKAYRFWGFIQPQFVSNEGKAVSGITVPSPGLASYNGRTAVFNQVGPDLSHGEQFQIFRARPGVRGVIPGTNAKINYFLLAELGNNGLTRERSAVITDATVSFNYIPGMRVRVGLGRLPVGEEAMLGEPAMDYINFTGATDGLLNERFVTPYANAARTHSPILGVPLKQSKLAGAVGGYRDVGVEVYDWFARGKWEYSYAVMVSRANGIGFNTENNPGNHDISGRLQASCIFGGKGPKREDVTVYIWHQAGKRAYAGSDYSRIREGVGAKYVHGSLRLGGEYIRGSGMIYVGPNPPFNDAGAPAFEPVTLVAVEASNTANGYYIDMGWTILPKIEADLRYDTYDRLPNSTFDERKFTTWTLGGQYFYNHNLRFTVNYEFRKLQSPAPFGTAAQKTQLTDAGIIGNSMGNRLSAQLTYTFSQ